MFNGFNRYRQYPQINLSNRTWPGKIIAKAPIWCSVDLRDGNQALSNPMNIDEKIAMFELLVKIGFKEIEVGFPSASEVEYEFIRKLINEKRIPDDVKIQVLTQSREDLIEKTFVSIKGAKHTIVHFYNSTSKIQREVVFCKNKEEINQIAVSGAKLIHELKQKNKDTEISIEYSPESFTGTELDFALYISHSVINIINPSPEQKIIINLPATVEMSTPNTFADRIEWFCNNIKNRESVILSVHTHNDRGTAVAAAELAIMAGADRVEGSLFGNGERTGNMDIITMAMNMYSQGINPELDFSNIEHIKKIYMECTHIDVHPRHPYAGELVYTAFSGSHQDAINKGMKNQLRSNNNIWDVPYLPIDPKDVGRDYKSIIRINSQSGKGGAAYIMENNWGIKIPKEMQTDFGSIIKSQTAKTGRELSSQEIFDCFKKEYLEIQNPYKLRSITINSMDEENKKDQDTTLISAMIQHKNQSFTFESRGNGPIDAFVQGIIKHLNIIFTITMYAEHEMSPGSDARAIAYIGIETNNNLNLALQIQGNRQDAQKTSLADDFATQPYLTSTGRSKITEDAVSRDVLAVSVSCNAGYRNNQKSFGAGMDANISIASIKAVLSALNRIK